MATTGDVVVVARTIDIQGTLSVPPGFKLFLVANENLTIAGSIVGQGADSTQERAEEEVQSLEVDEIPGVDWGVAGANVNVTGPIKLNPGDDLSISNIDVTLSVVRTLTVSISGTITTPNGRKGVAGKPGGKSGAIQVGSDQAIERLKGLAENTESLAGRTFLQPDVVNLDATLITGTGGIGFNDNGGTATGTQLSVTGTDGGAGGDIRIQAAKVLRAGGASLQAGRGGAGGKGGAGVHAADGVGSRSQGTSLNVRAGNGGRSGVVSLSAPDLEGEPAVTVFFGGDAGNIDASAGDGGPGGNGGNSTVTMPVPGADGAAEFLEGGTLVGSPPQPKGPAAVKSTISLQGGGNGGASDSAGYPGGNGGTVRLLSTQGGSTLDIAALSMINYGNGGKGFLGCPKLGSNGGDGGSSTGDPPGQRVTLTNSLNGGDGGVVLLGFGPGREAARGRQGGHFLARPGRTERQSGPRLRPGARRPVERRAGQLRHQFAHSVAADRQRKGRSSRAFRGNLRVRLDPSARPLGDRCHDTVRGWPGARGSVRRPVPAELRLRSTRAGLHGTDPDRSGESVGRCLLVDLRDGAVGQTTEARRPACQGAVRTAARLAQGFSPSSACT